ncbi:MAG TPA: tRNA threonylcarbamoyladenosine dehydratase [Ruminococcaceae bacterium]|nr:tRNA threonylcarbamoyladenosine dehydratase [Oscillospiraceae bacterium]
MLNQFSRTELLLGKSGVEKLAASTVAVFGVGGVGSFVCEALARSGVGKLVLFDNDTVALTNINRQLIALHSTIGEYKTEAMRRRILDINPNAVVEAHRCFYTAENASDFDFSQYTYIVDAIDTVSSKLAIIENAKAAGVPVISSMGTGNKLDPTRLEVSDIYKTSVCPLAKVMRYELKRRNIKSLKVVYSREEVVKAAFDDATQVETKGTANRPAPGSVAFVPSVAGLIIAGEVIKDIIKA